MQEGEAPVMLKACSGTRCTISGVLAAALVSKGELEIILTRYPMPAAVFAGRVALMLLLLLPAKLPMFTGLAKLPLASDNWAVKILLEP